MEHKSPIPPMEIPRDLRPKKPQEPLQIADWQRIVILVLVILIAVGLMFSTVDYTMQGAYQEEYNSAARVLRIERGDIVTELAQVERDLRSVVLGKDSATLVFTELDETLYTEALPILKEYGFGGVLALSPNSLPGQEGCITKEQLYYLLAHGWTTCVRWEGDTSLQDALDSLNPMLEELGIPLPPDLYVAYNGYQTYKDEQIIAAGFRRVIHHGEAEGIDLITREEEKEGDKLFRLGSVPWNHPAVKLELDQACAYGGGLALDVDFSTHYGSFDAELFNNMCKYPKSQEEKLYMTDLAGAQENISMLKRNDYLSTRKAFLEKELARCDKEIAAVYELELDEILAADAERNEKSE